MQNTLYLDMARRGRMSTPAYDASIDIARFAHEQGCPLYFSQLLQEGFANWPADLRERYRGLSRWQGVSELKNQLRQLANGNSQTEVLLTSRSATLMKFAARLLTGPCRRVLVTDTIWPAYKNILNRELHGASTQFSVVPIRHQTLRESMSSSELIQFLAREFVRRQCDGLFLPLVDNLGVRLPIEELVKEIRQRAELRFVVVDGAQAIGHVPLRIDTGFCDFLFAGSHKWLRAYVTMGIGFFGNRGSRDYIAESLQHWQQSGLIDDPLLSFCDELTTGVDQPFGETVQVAPLFVTDAATRELLSSKTQTSAEVQSQREAITEIAHTAGWQSVASHSSLASKILLFKHPGNQTDHHALRQRLLSHGVAATTYPNGMLRLSLPAEPLHDKTRSQLSTALKVALAS